MKSAAASFIALVFVSILGCAALGWREVEATVRIVGSDGGMVEGGAK